MLALELMLHLAGANISEDSLCLAHYFLVIWL